MKRIARVPCGFGGALFHLPWPVCSTICGRRVAKPHRQALVLVVQPVVLDHHILVLDIAGLCLWPDYPSSTSRWMSALPPKADIDRRDGNVRFVPIAS